MNQDGKKSLNPQQKNKIKSKLMEKYDISSEEAEKIIVKVLDKGDALSPKKSSNIQNHQIHQKTFENNSKNKQQVESTQKLNMDLANKIESNKKNVVFSSKENKDNSNKQKNGIELQNQKNNRVDDIMENIIPDYNQHVSIELDHVDLTFDVSNEKIDTLKETFIRTIKRNKSKTLKIHAINDISFKIYKGEKIGIIGYNGAGKSTLLNVITGIYPPDKGLVKTNGNISPLLSLGAGFDYNYSGRKNIFLNGAVLGYSKEFLESKVNEIIEFSELGEFIDIPIKNYSSGMLAKLGFSIATAVNPDILIIDEILGVGDVNFKKKSADKIKSLMDGGTTVLLVSHSIPQIRELCDKAIWIDKGKLREMGEVNQVCDHYLKDAEKASNEQLANIQFR